MLSIVGCVLIKIFKSKPGHTTTQTFSLLISSESGDPFHFLVRNAHPEESGWYWCVSGDFESGQHVAVVMSPPPAPPPTALTASPSFPPQMSRAEESQEPMGPLKVYNRFETKWTERQVMDI